MLPGDHALALVAVPATPGIVRQDRDLGFLGLQEQRLVAVPGVHQHDPGAGADAADPDDLAGHLDQGELLEQVPPVGLQAAPVLAQHGADLLVDRVGLHVGEDLLDRDDHRRVADDNNPSVRFTDAARSRAGLRPPNVALAGEGPKLRLPRVPGVDNCGTGDDVMQRVTITPEQDAKEAQPQQEEAERKRQRSHEPAPGARVAAVLADDLHTDDHHAGVLPLAVQK